MKEIRALTSLRGVFAIWVMIHHLQMFAPSPIAALSLIGHRGYLSVDFFFMLSGFILAATYGQKFSFNIAAYSRFLIRRWGRLFPLFLFIAAIVISDRKSVV